MKDLRFQQRKEKISSHDVFCFPSFREPAGNVLYEAMRHGLPIITADRGGPAWIVDASVGIKIPVTNPGDFATDIAAALRKLSALCKPQGQARVQAAGGCPRG